MLLLPGESLNVNIPAPYPRAVSSLRRLVDGLQRRSTLFKGILALSQLRATLSKETRSLAARGGSSVSPAPLSSLRVGWSASSGLALLLSPSAPIKESTHVWGTC